MLLVARAFTDGRPAMFSTRSVRCPATAAAFGLEEPEWRWPGGYEGTLRLLSSGNCGSEEGSAALEELKATGASGAVLDEFRNGEGFKKEPGLVAEWFASMPSLPVMPYAVLMPLSDMDVPPEAVVVLADCLQLAALTTLANFARSGDGRVLIPHAAACMSVGLYPLAESLSAVPRAVVGMLDISCRSTMWRVLGRDLLSFSMPWSLFCEMESNADASFMSRNLWRGIGRKAAPPSSA
ncbi:MAG: DUF169 domain-containing protein [Deltaproteobacteria bacterium]|jgi:hypothetical protein|nr:DUF169 domain-containing protein [Deltaproteobacteria bacterium]